MNSEEKTIIHFTDSAAALKGILSDGFRIKYCKECIWFGDVEKNLRVPMVSFCDIPIAQAKDHMKKYGHYALGFTEEWADRNGMTKVNYLERKSTLAANKIEALNFAITHAEQDPDETKLMKVLDELRYMKNYKGELWRKGVLQEEKYYFGDEHEWRYSPNTGHFYQFLYMEEMFTKRPDLATLVQDLIAAERLSFVAEDVRYILIEKEEDRAELETHIRSLTKRFSEVERENLVTKIRTAAQIEEESQSQKSS